jgi:hypothetical protein
MRGATDSKQHGAPGSFARAVSARLVAMIGRRVQSFWEFARLASDQMRTKLDGGGMSRSAFAAELMYHLFKPSSAYWSAHICAGTGSHLHRDRRTSAPGLMDRVAGPRATMACPSRSTSTSRTSVAGRTTHMHACTHVCARHAHVQAHVHARHACVHTDNAHTHTHTRAQRTRTRAHTLTHARAREPLLTRTWARGACIVVHTRDISRACDPPAGTRSATSVDSASSAMSSQVVQTKTNPVKRHG